MTDTLLEVKDLKIAFQTLWGENTVVDKFDFCVDTKEVVAFVGESGCGKSVTAMSLTRIMPSPPARILEGSVVFNGVDLLRKSEKYLRGIRGKDISYIFQEPSLALNPVYSIGNQIAESMKIHKNLSKGEMEDALIKSLNDVLIPEPKDRLKSYPHQLSGGMKQRVMIAMALMCEPKLLIADEPTTALDVTVQREILNLLKHLHETKGMSILLTTHDFGIVQNISRRIYVMYAGEVVETSSTEELFKNPKHPYTKALLGSIPCRARRAEKLNSIPGEVPKKLDGLKGCRFANRCEFVQDDCRRTHPELEKINERTSVRCPYWKSLI